VNVLFAASEAAPYAKTGGLADVAGSLPAAIASLGHDVRLVIPRYRSVDPERFGLRHVAQFIVPLGSWKERCDLYEAKPGGITVYFIGKDIYFDRPGLYGSARADYLDNAERFVFFSRAVLELCGVTGFSPDIIHCNDWQTALVPLLLARAYPGRPEFERTRTALTIHNLGYQGIFWHWDMRLLDIGWDVFTPDGVEFFGRMNFLKAGVVFSDVLTTVSKTYSREIRTPEYGHGLDGVLAKRVADLHGIVNGIDPDLWDPARDARIAATYSASDLAGKRACKQALRTLAGLPESDAPVVGMVTRLAAQKGIDIVADALPGLRDLGIQLVILGTGDEKYQRMLTDEASLHPDQMRLFLEYDDAKARAIYAGSDLFLMPSRYEPCGLGQMIALRYGTVPLVRNTGGLADTVEDFEPGTKKGTGFLFDEYSPEAFLACCRRAVDAWRDKRAWTAMMKRGMALDFSWARSAREYVTLYRSLTGDA
jgi:starch synthase